MNMLLEPLESAELLAFARIVETGSLSRAAQQLGVPRVTLGRRLQRLEERLRTRLLRRTTRRLVLTDAGKRLHTHARGILAALEAAEASVSDGSTATRGLVRVAAPPMLDSALAQLFVDFRRHHPDVRLEVHTQAGLVDIVARGYDVALRATQAPTPGLINRVVMRSKLVAVASPRYLAKRGTPRTVKALSEHACLLGFDSQELPRTHWPKRRGGNVRVEGELASNDLGLLANAALAGEGIALLPQPLVQPAIDAGKLSVVLDEQIGTEACVALVFPERELMPPAVRTFIDHAVAWFGTHGSDMLVRRHDACHAE